MGMVSAFEGKSALLVEDQALVAMVVRDMLLELGFSAVEHVLTLAAAMISAKDRPPDIAILDLHVTDGITLPVAELLALRRVRSIFVSGDFDVSSKYGINEKTVLTKPFAPADLQAALIYAFDAPLLA